MHDGTAVARGQGMVYRYDGSFEGFLCCIYDRYTRREPVLEIWLEGEGALSLYPTREVETVATHADRVYASLPGKLGGQGLELLKTVFLSHEAGRETDMLRFVELGYAHGPAVAGMLAHPAVNHLHRLWKNVTNEAHRYKQFLRFEEVLAQESETTLPMLPGAAEGYQPRGLLVGTIQPQNHVLPLIAPHFCDRYPQERMLIHDVTHGQAMLYQPYQVELLTLETLPEGLAGENGLYQQLWKNYCRTTAIMARANPRCQMGMMPKRYWKQMLEMQ